MNRLVSIVGALLAVFFVGLMILRASALTFVENYEQGFMFDARTGKISRIDHPGWVITTPLMVWTNTIDLRPMQLCIAANKRVLNCKLVAFDPNGLEEFLSIHGFEYDSQTRATEDTTALGEMLKSYVFDGSKNKYSFVKVLREMRNEELDTLTESTPTMSPTTTAPTDQR